MGNEGRPVPPHGRAAGTLIDFERWHVRSMTDGRSPGRIDADEAIAGMPILIELAADARPMVANLELIATCVSSRDGVFGHRPRRAMRDLLRIGNVSAFRRRLIQDDAPEAA